MTRTATLDASAQADNFGQVYLWLRRHHRRVGSTVAKTRRPWAAIAREAEAAGVRNTLGTAPTSDQVRQVWSRVSRDLAREQAAKAAAPAPPPRSRGPNVEPPSRPGQNAPVRSLAAPAVAAPPPASAPASADHQATAPPLKPYQMTGEQKVAWLQQQARDLSPKPPVPKFSGPLE